MADTITREPTMTKPKDPKADRETIRLLRKVRKLRAELRTLEPELIKACLEWGSRRGAGQYREWHVVNDLERMGKNV